MHRSFLALAAIVAVAGAAALVPACSNEGEGERCDMRGGNDECQSGLTCTLGTSLPSKPGSDVCCPTDLTSTTPICSRQVGLDAGPPPPDDAAPADATADTSVQSDASDTGADVGSDSGADTGVDATTDTGVDGATDSGDAGADADAASDV